jgi:signal transduction histidine kinase
LQMKARENERLRIAQDLHDTLLQGLLSASFQLSVVHDQLAPESKPRQLLDHVSGLLRRLVIEGRNTVRGLRTWDFDSDNLEHAISAVPGDLQIASDAEFRVVIEGTPRALLPAARTELYLIAREAISNSLRHAQATLVEVSLEYAIDSFRLSIRDNGCGFSTSTAIANHSSHFGLSVMSERADRLGAAINASSGIGVGTEISLSLPGHLIYHSHKSKARS